MLLFSYLWLTILADYFLSPTSSYMFSFRCWWKWETTQKLKSINNKYFILCYHQQDDKGKHCICLINYTRTRQYMFEPNAKLSTGTLRDWTWSLLCYIYQELTLSTNTVVLKQGKLQHAAVYIIKFRMTSLYKWSGIRENTKRGALLHGVPYGVPKMEYPWKSCISQIKYFRNMVNRLDVHTFIYFELPWYTPLYLKWLLYIQLAAIITSEVTWEGGVQTVFGKIFNIQCKNV